MQAELDAGLPSQPVLMLLRIRRTLTTPHILLSLILIVLMLYLVAVPLLRMAKTTVTWLETDTRLSREAEPGALTLFHWQRILDSRISKTIFWTPLVNSLVTALWTAVLGVVLGSLLAWLVVRTDLPLKGPINTLATIPYTLPAWTLAFAWIALFKNERIGGAVGFLQYAFGVSTPDWLAYGALPIIITLTVHYFPFTYLLVSGALVSIDSQLEESGDVLGASRLTILRRITFPLITPALLSAFVLTFSRGLGSFAAPYFLGLPVRYFTLASTIFNTINTRQPGEGYAMALVLIAISMVIIYINQRIIGTRRSFVTIAGKGWRARPTPLGRWRWPIAGISLIGLGSVVIIPLGLLFWQTLLRKLGNYSLDNLTLHFWIGASTPEFAEGEMGILRNRSILGAAWNSVRLSVTVALLTGIVGIFIGYAIVKGRGTWLSRFVEQGSFIPYLIPAIAFGAIYLSMFITPFGPIPALYGTFALLVLACTVKNLPFSARAGVSSMMQVAGELEEAAMVVGASWVRRFVSIIFPLTVRGALSGFLLTFIATMRELSLIILLVTPATRTLTTMTFRYAEQGYEQFSDAIIILLVVLILIGEGVARRLGRVELEQGRAE